MGKHKLFVRTCLRICSPGLSKTVRQMLGAEAQATDRLRVNGFEQKAEVYETAQKEYRRLRREKRKQV